MNLSSAVDGDHCCLLFASAAFKSPKKARPLEEVLTVNSRERERVETTT